ncbi:MAG: hypothetical protein BWX72_01566 [Firmicutes bacterium ADurb.Bin080]|nr:MAG: hypothetical protein BWX72_01566 [Firmicutes bacterium ADurb.Bin080]
MGQGDIHKILTEKQDWMLSKELLDIVGMSPGGLYRLLRILEKNKEIKKEKAINVIKDKDRLNNSSKKAWAYKIIK